MFDVISPYYSYLVIMQKQNPFLKPTPLFSNSYASSSFSAYPPASKYPSYSSFEVSKPMANYDSYSNNMERLPEASQASRFKSTADIHDILKNNPFNRPPPSIFSGSSANSYSPAKYQSSKNYQPYPSSSYERPNLDLYAKPRTNYSMNDKPVYSQSQTQNRHTPKKHDNYLSTSSADSATTYINRIYQLEDEKSEGTSNLSNPFLRKNLIEDRTYQKQLKSPNSYDNAALKYIASNKQKPYLENNYFAASKQPTQKSNNYELNSYKAYQDNEQPYKPKVEYNSYKGGKYDKYDANIQKYDSKYNAKHEISLGSDKYESKYDKYDAKFNNYDKYEPKQDYKDKPSSKNDIYQPSKYEQYTSPQYDSVNSKFNFEQEDSYGHKPKASQVNDQFDFSDKYNSKKYEEQMKREKYAETLRREKEEFQDSMQPKGYEQYGYDHKYSFKPEYNPKEQSKKSLQRIPSFGQSKHKAKEYSAADYETLGGRQEYNHKSKQQVIPIGSKKLISSQVQQYATNPYKTQTSNPYKPQASYKPYEQSHHRQKFMAYDQQQQQGRMKSKGAVRDHQQGFPKMLQYNGMVFYRIEVK